ncbi:MAG: glycosyltransferase family 1 protein [Clostridia bacterium]|nr:glycosyltransferase family 1 protein [Clostridia bacterium]
MSTKRLLCCMSSMDTGGAETFLMKQYRQIDREKYQMDFCVNVAERGYYDDEIEALGGRIYRIPPKSQDFKKSLKALEDIVRDNGYENVMCSSVKPGTALELIAAKKGGAKRLIYRSSNSSVDGGRKQKILHSTVGQLAKIVPTVKFAPSKEAAEYCFGKGCIRKGKAFLLHNGIDTGVYRYSDKTREEMRREFGFTDEYVIAHVGRFSAAKNHTFLLDVFEEILKIKPNSVLMLVGKGELSDEIKQKAKDKNILNKIRFLGLRSDVPKVLCAADVFVFPSFYEGMPNTVIEAQSLSLHCVISDRITPEADITGLVEYLPLGDATLWAQTAAKYADGYERHEMTEIFKKQKYDSETTAKEFVKHCFGE